MTVCEGVKREGGTTWICEVVRNLSVNTAVEESDGRDSSVVRRPIEIVSNPRHNPVRSPVHRTPQQL